MPAKLFSRSVVFFSLSAIGLIASSAARADDNPENYTIEEVQACSADAMRLCHDDMPDVHKIEKCMRTKRSLLSQPCQAMFEPGHKR